MTFKLGNQAKTWGSAALFFLVTTVLCGVIYTAACTGLAQLFFPHQANGSIIEVDGTKYGSELVGQRFTDEKHLWGRAMNPSTGTFTDAEGNDVLWYAPSNLSPAGDEFATAVQDRVEQIRAAHPEMGNKPIPSDLVTNSGSGFDPHISPAAATSSHRAACRRRPGGPFGEDNRQERVRDPRHHQAMHRAAPVRFSGGCARERAESEPDARRRAMMAAPIRLRV